MQGHFYLVILLHWGVNGDGNTPSIDGDRPDRNGVGMWTYMMG